MSRPGKTVNRAALAQTFGVSLPTVEKWIRSGCPHLEQGGLGKQWQFDTAAVHRWLLERHAEGVIAAYGGKGDGKLSIEEARRRTAIATMRVAEIEAAREERGIVDVEYVGEIFREAVFIMSAALNGLGAKVAGRASSMRDPNAIRKLVDDELRVIVAEMQERLGRAWGEGDAPADRAQQQPEAAP